MGVVFDKRQIGILIVKRKKMSWVPGNKLKVEIAMEVLTV